MDARQTPKLTASQLELLAFMACQRGKEGVWTLDRHYEATTFASLRRKRLIGFYVPPTKWTAPRYKITPAGRAALKATGG